MNRREFGKIAAGSLAVMATGAIPKSHSVEDKIDQCLRELYSFDPNYGEIKEVMFLWTVKSDIDNRTAFFMFRDGSESFIGISSIPFYPHEWEDIKEIAGRRNWKTGCPGYWHPQFNS